MPRNRKEDLRPIGTIFVFEFPADESSTNPYRHIVTYRVKDYVVCADFDEEGQIIFDSEGVWKEALEVLLIKEV